MPEIIVYFEQVIKLFSLQSKGTSFKWDVTTLKKNNVNTAFTSIFFSHTDPFIQFVGWVRLWHILNKNSASEDRGWLLCLNEECQSYSI